MKRAAYRCYHCGQEHEDGRRNPCEDRGRQAARYPVWRDGEVEMFPGHVHEVKGDTTMEKIEDLGRRALACPECRAHRDRMEALWVAAHEGDADA